MCLIYFLSLIRFLLPSRRDSFNVQGIAVGLHEQPGQFRPCLSTLWGTQFVFCAPHVYLTSAFLHNSLTGEFSEDCGYSFHSLDFLSVEDFTAQLLINCFWHWPGESGWVWCGCRQDEEGIRGLESQREVKLDPNWETKILSFPIFKDVNIRAGCRWLSQKFCKREHPSSISRTHIKNFQEW